MRNIAKHIMNFLGFVFVRGIIYPLLRNRSIEFRYAVAKFIAEIIYKVHRKGRERIKTNISLIRPDWFVFQIEIASKRLVETFARSWAALLGNESTSLAEIEEKLKLKGMEPLLECYRANRQIIVTAVHVGPIDEMVGVIALYNLQVYIPIEAMKPDWLYRLILRLRLRFPGILFEPVQKGLTLDRARIHLRDEKNRRIVVLVVDALRDDKSGVLCRIGNAKAYFPVGAVKLALEEEDAVLFPVFTSWDEEAGWGVQLVVGEPFDLIRTGNLAHDIETNMKRLIENVFWPHIKENCYAWLRMLHTDLISVGPDEDPLPSKQAMVDKDTER